MIGHQQIVTLRNRGMRPAGIVVADYPGKLPDEADCMPTVFVADDEPARTDLRFVNGCQVHLHADDSSRASAWVDRLLQDGAKSVIQLTQGEIYVWRA